MERVRRQGVPVARAGREAGASRQTANPWLARFDAAGGEGLRDRSSRPRRIAWRTVPPAGAAHGAAASAEESGLGDRARARGCGLDGLATAPAARPGPDRAARAGRGAAAALRARGAPGICSTSMRRSSLGSERWGSASAATAAESAAAWATRSSSSAPTTTHAAGLRRGLSLGARLLRRHVPPPSPRRVRPPGHPLPAAPEGPRQVLRGVETLPGRLPGARHPAELHAALHAPNQRQGRALPPDPRAPLRLPLRVRDGSHAHRAAAALAHALQ